MAHSPLPDAANAVLKTLLPPPDVHQMAELARMRREGRQALNETAVLFRIAEEKLQAALSAFPVKDEGTREHIERVIGHTAMSRHLISHLVTIVG